MPGVYISYPFCAQKCTYCNFASGVFPREQEWKYVEGLIAEIRAAQWDEAPDTVYLGGGTPSSLDPQDLARILDAVPGHPWREATIEAAPGGISADLAVEWKRIGINRVSLGVQSFLTAELRRTGRRHTAEIVASEIEMLRGAGIDNINIDLIAGLPGQTAASWRESLDHVERLAPPHVSVYMLEVDEDSRLGAEILLGGKRYGASDTPADEAIAAMYETAGERLAQMGIARYEISNFARPGYESLHNLKYWQLDPYLGFGADAHSFDGRTRWSNPESLSDYLRGAPRSTEPAGNDERFFVGLRLMRGIAPSEQEWDRHETAIRGFLEDGLLEQSEGRLRLTSRGVMISNDVFQEFLNV